MLTRRNRWSSALVVTAALLGAACSTSGSSGSASGDGAAPRADGIDVPLPTIGLGSDTGSGGAAVAVEAGQIERVVMIGDSITVGAAPYLQQRFDEAGLAAEIGAQEGKRIDVNSNGNPAGTVIAEQFATGVGAGGDVLWVVALGTNDIGQYADQADVETDIRELLESVPPDAPLVWINTWFRDRPDATVMVNAAIASVVRDRGNATVGDWSIIAPIDGILRSDGVHPNDDGAQTFADLVVGTVRGFLQL